MLEVVVTPYVPSAFLDFIKKFNLSSSYPFLVEKISHGFRLGDLAPMLSSFTPQNHPSAFIHSDIISQYLEEEKSKGRMAGPFSRLEMESIVGGPFRSSPIQVVEKFDADGKLVKARMAINLSFKDSSGVSVNDMIDSDDTPTRWGTAEEMEAIVSLFCFLHSAHLSF